MDAILAQLEALALSHPEVFALIARTINAAFHSTSPARAIVRHLIREAAEGASDELADELSTLTPVEGPLKPT
jgi:hypothetical protein